MVARPLCKPYQSFAAIIFVKRNGSHGARASLTKALPKPYIDVDLLKERVATALRTPYQSLTSTYICMKKYGWNSPEKPYQSLISITMA